MNKVIGPILSWAKENQETANRQSLLESSDCLSIEEIENRNPFQVPVDFTGKDYVSMLVSIDAEIEHGLMLQYLYAAYTIGGPQVPPAYRDKVRSWQEVILGVAKEEMGHFISVQNVLKVMGASLNFGRESYPWDTPFYPFPFTLERFTLDSLAKYVYAEAPSEWLDEGSELAQEIIARVKANVNDPHTVGALFKVILALVKDPAVVPDEVFQASTYPYQAKFDEWGRGYAGGARGTAANGHAATPDVLVVPLASRDDTYNALEEIAEQGEGEEIDPDNPSHFERFLAIYEEMKEVIDEAGGAWHPSRNVASNPYVASDDLDEDILPADGAMTSEHHTPITKEETSLWASLLNVRYRLLLNFLNHSFLLDDGFNKSGAKSPRGMIINSTFGEMYNLRSISTVLVRMPVSDAHPDLMAGPPFTSPYTMELPFGEHNRWRLHQDLIKASRKIIIALRPKTDATNHRYLNALEELDKSLLADIEQLTAYAG